jgi:hypothetical protein
VIISVDGLEASQTAAVVEIVQKACGTEYRLE